MLHLMVEMARTLAISEQAPPGKTRSRSEVPAVTILQMGEGLGRLRRPWAGLGGVAAPSQHGRAGGADGGGGGAQAAAVGEHRHSLLFLFVAEAAREVALGRLRAPPHERPARRRVGGRLIDPGVDVL